MTAHDRIVDLNKRVEELEAALTFYANRDNYRVNMNDGTYIPRPVVVDAGRIARVALGTEAPEVTNSRQGVA